MLKNPDGYHVVTPWIISRDTVRLISFVTEAFAAEELARMEDEAGAIGHAEFRIGDSIAMPSTPSRVGRSHQPFSAFMSPMRMSRKRVPSPPAPAWSRRSRLSCGVTGGVVGWVGSFAIAQRVALKVPRPRKDRTRDG